MIRDSFYRQIIKELKGELDPDQFEDCAADILRTIYPALVPIRGGSDAGMDGAIADGLGEPFPLVTTTGSNVIGNVTRNLQKYIDEGGTRRKVVLATSQALTPIRRRNIEKRVRELGFNLVNIHEQTAIANLLHHDPKWCRHLLGISGDPSPLSVIPRTDRPLLEAPLIGRETDLDWLKKTKGDCLLVGQPGSGKTFLLHKFAMDGGGLFAISQDRDKIADSIRSQRPKAIIVDDAQNILELIRDLKQMRTEMDEGYSIIASCWPGEIQTIKEVLNLTESQIHQLDLLRRPEIVQVIKSVGVYGPDKLLYSLMEQSEGRPGLAITLALFCLRGDIRQVANGEILRISLLTFFERLLGKKSLDVLAAFAIGGDSGMTMQDVARGIGMGLVEIRSMVTQLAAGGVIMEISRERLSVRPPSLRYVLVRDVFFYGATSLNIAPLLEQPSIRLEKAAVVLIGAKARGALIDPSLLKRFVENSTSDHVWNSYASLGREETQWILEYHSNQIIRIAQPALRFAPEDALSHLLQNAIGDDRPLHSNTDHPLRIVSDWIDSAYPGTGEVLKRRKTLLDVIEKWFMQQGDMQVGLRALRFVLSPQYEGQWLDPSDENTMTIQSGYITFEEVQSLQNLWPRIIEIIKTHTSTNLKPVCEMVETWAYSSRVMGVREVEIDEIMRPFAIHMLQDILPYIQERLGMLHWAGQIAKHLEADITIPLSREFEILYPSHDYTNWQEDERRQRLAVEDLAKDWQQVEPFDVIKRVIKIEQEAQLSDLRWPRWTPHLLQKLAEQTAFPSQWVRAVIAADGTGDLVYPFLRRSCELGVLDSPELLLTCFDSLKMQGAAVALALTLPNPPDQLLERVWVNLSKYTEFINSACVRKEIPELLVRRLLRHEDDSVVCATAEGEWHAEPQGTVRESLREDWQRVVVNKVNDKHWLSEVLRSDVHIAEQWLQVHLTETNWNLFYLTYERVIDAAIESLDIGVRRRLLFQIPNESRSEILIAKLINGNIELYRDFLAQPQLTRFHLVPLTGTPEGVWFDKAILALDAGYSPEMIAQATLIYRGVVLWSGEESKMWEGWLQHFDKLCSHENARIRQIGEVGKRDVTRRRGEALRRERHEAIYGYH